MADQSPQLFAFEIVSSENFAYIPLSVRFHLDRTGLRISLDQWQRLPLDRRIALSSYPVNALSDAPTVPDVFAHLLQETLFAHTGEQPESETPPPFLPGDDVAEVYPGLAVQCDLAGLPPVTQADWAALSRFQRYALAKLSRKPKANHDFIPAMREFGLA